MVPTLKSKSNRGHPLSSIAFLSITFSHIVADFKRHPITTILLSLFTAILASIIAILWTAKLQSPLVFLSFAEQRIGETDIIILPSPLLSCEHSDYVVRDPLSYENISSDTGLHGLNISRLRKALKRDHGTSRGIINEKPAPRWISAGYTTTEDGKESSRQVASYLLAIDTELERELRIGRSWDGRAGGKLEAYMSHGMANALGIIGSRGMRANFTISLWSLMKGLRILDTSGNNTITSLLHKAGIDVGLSINISPQRASWFVSDRAPMEYRSYTDLKNTSSFADAVFMNMNGNEKSTLENMDNTILVPTEVLSASLSNFLDAGPNAKVEFTIIDVVSAPQGKWPAGYGNVVAIEANQSLIFMENMLANVFSSPALHDILRTHLEPFGAFTELVVKEIRERILGLFRDLDVYSTAHMVGIQSLGRTTTFAQTDQTARQSFTRFTDYIGTRVGTDSAAEVDTPLLLAFEELDFLQVVLSQFFNIFILIFAAMGCVVLWSASRAQIDELTTASWNMRILGMSRYLLRRFGALVSLRHSIVGTVLGTLLTVAGLSLISHILSNWLRMPAREVITVPILLAVVLGVIVPCFGTMIPCTRVEVVSKRSRRTWRCKQQQNCQVIVKSLQHIGWNVWVLIVSSIMTIYGALFYFFLPKSFLEENYSLFFGIMNISVTGIMLGLVIIFQPLQESVQIGFVFLFMAIGKACNFLRGVSTRSEKCLFPCVCRNVRDHQNQSRKAGLVLSFSVALLTFSWSFTKIQVISITESVRELVGSDILFTATTRLEPLNETELRRQMTILTSQNVVSRFSFITFPLPKEFQVSGISQWPVSEPLTVYGIDKYFFETVFQDLTLLSRNSKNWSEDSSIFQVLQRSLDCSLTQKRNRIQQDDNGTMTVPIALSHGFRDIFGIDSSSVLRLTAHSISIRATAPILVHKLPGFMFSAFSTRTSTSPLLMAELSYRRIYHALTNDFNIEKSTEQLDGFINESKSPKQRLLVKLNPSYSNPEVKDEIRMLGTDGVIVQEIEESLKEVKGLERMLSAVNSTTLFMLLLLSCSMLFVVFKENAKATYWQMGLLRALGITSKQVFQMLTYEYVSLSVYGVLAGSIIGFIAIFILVLQDELFRGIRREMKFPFLPNTVLSIASLLTAILASTAASRNILNREACSILRET